MKLFRKLQQHRDDHRLSYRLLAYILLCSTVLALIITAITLYWDYRQDITDIQDGISQIEVGLLPAISKSLWNLDSEQLDIQMKGIMGLPDMQHVAIYDITDGKRNLMKELGETGDSKIINRVFKLTNNTKDIGELAVTASLTGVYNRLLNKSLLILTSQTVKTLIVSILILFIVFYLVVRYLDQMVEYTRTLDLEHLDDELVLIGKHEKSEPDALDFLAKTLNQMRLNLRDDMEKHKKMEEFLRQNSQRDQLLKELAIAANEASEPDAILLTTIRYICQYNGWPIGHVYMLSEEKPNELISSSLWCINDPEKFKKFREATDRISYTLGVGLPGRVLANRKPCWITDINDDSNFPRLNVAKEVNLQSAFAFPVIVERKVVAVLEFFHEQSESKNETMNEMMEQVGIQLGTVIQRKKAIDELNNHRERLEDLVEERTGELKTAQKELVKNERLAVLGELTATVSHELRNPLGTVLPALYILRKKVDPMDSSVGKALNRIERSINRCDNIVDELLDFTRIVNTSLQTTQFDKWIREVIDEQVVPDGLNLKFDLTLTDLLVDIDQDRLRRAVTNAFENAWQSMIKKLETKELAPNSRVTLTTRTVDQRIELLVVDNGPGIEEDVLPKIFEPLFSTKNFGVGLGLPTVKQIMEQHGGGIVISSKKGEGTQVVLWLPLKLIREVAA